MINEEMPKITIIIPTYNNWGEMTRCLNAILDQTYPKSLIEIIIANNSPDSKPPTDNISYAKVTILEVAEPGSYAARNAALKESSGEIIAFTDSDCTPDQDWIYNGVKQIMRGYSRVAGHVSLVYSDKPTIAEIYEKAFAFRQENNVKKGVSVTANLFVRRDVFSKVGFFNGNLLSGGDMEWNNRATKEGLSISYANDAIVYHPARSQFEDLKNKERRIAGGFAKLYGFSPAFLLRLALSPLRQIYFLQKRTDLSLKERATASLCIIFLKFYCVINYALVALKLAHPQRT